MGVRKEALQEVYDKYIEQIYKFVYFKVGNREDAEDNQRNHFLYRLQLCRRKLIVPNPIRRQLEVILDEGDSPTDKNHDPQGRVFLLEMPVPSEGHEDVGHDEQ